ncbi:MAG: hypothetical protein KDK41_14570 [Leptospiraceae bacterium]|nr:hypothetical protein [Leptospiraceae bacterium]
MSRRLKIVLIIVFLGFNTQFIRSASLNLGIGAAINSTSLFQIALAEAICPEDDSQCVSQLVNLAGELVIVAKLNLYPLYVMGDGALGYDYRFSSGNYSKAKAGVEGGFYIGEDFSLGFGYGWFNGQYFQQNRSPAGIRNGRSYWASFRFLIEDAGGEISISPTFTNFGYTDSSGSYLARDFSLLWRYTWYLF